MTGPVAVKMRSSLPFDGISFVILLLAGAKVVVNPLISDRSSLDQSPDLVEQEFPDLFPACAVTRAMGKRGIENDFCCTNDLAGKFIGQIYNAEVNKYLDISPSEFQLDYGTENIHLLSDHSRDTSLNDKGHDKLSRSQFIDGQHRDPENSCLFGKAISENEVSQVPVCYLTKNKEMATTRCLCRH